MIRDKLNKTTQKRLIDITQEFVLVVKYIKEHKPALHLADYCLLCYGIKF